MAKGVWLGMTGNKADTPHFCRGELCSPEGFHGVNGFAVSRQSAKTERFFACGSE